MTRIRRRIRRRAALSLLAAGALAALLAGCGSSGSNQVQHVTATGPLRGVSSIPAPLQGATAPRIRQTDDRGGTLDTNALRGTPYAVTFLYANCPDVCPLITQEIVTSLKDIGGDAQRVAIVAVSVDPHGDTRENVASFLKRHGAPDNFHYVIGSQQQLKPVWRSYFAAPQIPGDPESSHTAAIWLVDGQGRLRGKFDAGQAFNPADLAHDFEVLLKNPAGTDAS